MGYDLQYAQCTCVCVCVSMSRRIHGRRVPDAIQTKWIMRCKLRQKTHATDVTGSKILAPLRTPFAFVLVHFLSIFDDM